MLNFRIKIQCWIVHWSCKTLLGIHYKMFSGAFFYKFKILRLTNCSLALILTNQSQLSKLIWYHMRLTNEDGCFLWSCIYFLNQSILMKCLLWLQANNKMYLKYVSVCIVHCKLRYVSLPKEYKTCISIIS